MIAWLSTKLGKLIGGIGALVMIVGAAFLSGRREGAQNATHDAKEADYVKANEIDDRVAGARRVHDEDIRFRD